MTDTDAWFLAVGMAGLALAVILLAFAVKQQQMDLELLRITAAVPDRSY